MKYIAARQRLQQTFALFVFFLAHSEYLLKNFSLYIILRWEIEMFSYIIVKEECMLERIHLGLHLEGIDIKRSHHR